MLKGLAVAYVMAPRELEPLYHRQREVLVDLVHVLSERAPIALEPPFAADWAEAADDAARLRVVIDQVASLTDVSAAELHARLVHPPRHGGPPRPACETGPARRPPTPRLLAWQDASGGRTWRRSASVPTSRRSSAQHVTLRSAGVGSMKGLCPFHDERSPSFHVRPQVGRYHCFGCGEGGDVIDFVQKVDGLGFSEAVEYLAGKVGLQLRYEEGGAPRPGEEPGKRRRLIEAHKVAEEFYREQLSTPAAAAGRAVPRRARVRPDRRGRLRRRVRAAGLGLAHAAPARTRVHRGRADARPGWSARGSAASTTGSAAGWCGPSAR